MKKGAVISADGKYRYSLFRQWESPALSVTFLMLNPSTADADLDDPTIRRCIGFAKSWGYGKIEVVNLYALRAADPDSLYIAADPIGPKNASYLADAFRNRTVCAWGTHPKARAMGSVLEMTMAGIGVESWCLGTTKDGSPKHPLYLRADTALIPWLGYPARK